MLFRTELRIPESVHKISHHHKILLLGSCFSQNIGDRLQKYKFKSISNPFGTIFHPVAIAKALKYTIEKKLISEDELLLSQGVYVHPDFHSMLSDVNKAGAAQKINHTIATMHEELKETSYVFITLGTSTGYRLRSTGELVANCHKMPPSMYVKEEVATDEITRQLDHAVRQLREISPDIQIILTVSPVRHIKDGIIENTRSKARLINCIETLVGANSGVSYFPAYEWMMDDLRDYRYYEKDLIHPNESAIDYIWEKFCEHYFDKETTQLTHQISKILTSCGHRPFNASTDNHQQFVQEVTVQIKRLLQTHSYLNFEEELKTLRSLFFA